MKENDLKLPRYEMFGKCITRACTIKAVQKNALNLSQGFPEEEPIEELRIAASDAILTGSNQYADMRGLPALRQAIAKRYREYYEMSWVDSDRNVSITCGATEAMAAAILATAGPGDEIIVQEPTYENYPPQVMIAGAKVRYLMTEGPDWKITREALGEAFCEKTRAIIINNPNNPTGRVFSYDELLLISEYCNKYNAIALVDEIYEHLVWDDNKHIRLATLPGMQQRTITISGASKVYSVTGWRIGWAIAPERLTIALQRIHDFLTATVPTPLQVAIASVIDIADSYYAGIKASYEKRRDILKSFLNEAGLEYHMPEGAYYYFPSCKKFKFNNSVEFSDNLLEEAGVAVVPFTAFYRSSGIGEDRFRVNFAKKEETLKCAGMKISEFCRNHK